MASVDDDVETFCRQVRARSAEHNQAMTATLRFPSVAAGILRQELDSMVRVVFLLGLSDPDTRSSLVGQSVRGIRWSIRTPKGKSRHVTDREMVDHANNLHGWTGSVYRFGCGFIHLSRLHDHLATDPFQALPEEEREWIASHIRYYHGGSFSSESTFGEMTRHFPMILRKISENLDCCLRELERGFADGAEEG